MAKQVGATIDTTTRATNIEWVKYLGVDIPIDYKQGDFETILCDYDVALNSQDTKMPEKSLRILKAGGKLISSSEPTDADFAKELGLY